MQYIKVKGLTCLLCLLLLAGSADRVVGQNLQIAELTTAGVNTDGILDNTPSSNTTLPANIRDSHDYRIDNYDHILPETLGERGRVFMEQGLYYDAEQTFSQALHAQRINHGLYDIGQIPLLEGLLETLLIQRKWEKLNQRLQYWEHLNSKAKFRHVKQFLNSIDRLSGLYIAAAASRGSSESAWYLVCIPSAPVGHNPLIA